MLNAGANPGICNNAGRTALSVTRASDEDIQLLLQNAYQQNKISQKQAFIRFQNDMNLFLKITQKTKITADDQNTLNTFFKGS